MTPHTPLALIAEDEPLLAASLQRELRQLWPELRTEIATDGVQAVSKALAQRPDILFLDVRMPGCTGLEAAQDIADSWPVGHALPVIVFITAFDHYAVQAFEQSALDYLVKPVKTERMATCVQRIQTHLSPRFLEQNRLLAGMESAQIATVMRANARDEQLLRSLHHLVHSAPPHAAQHQNARLQRIQASVGNHIVFVPIQEVLCFQAADKYVRVLTASRELLIRTPIKDLLPQLDAQEFWQVHRSTVVRASAIEAVLRDESHKQRLKLSGLSEQVPVSRLYAHLFQAM